MTSRYAVIGNPIAQSKSPIIHAAFAAALGHEIDYARIEAPIDGFADAIETFRAMGGEGLNVTTPFKIDAHDIATTRSDRVRRAGAANCLRFRVGHIEAENFDGIGLCTDLERNLSTPLADRRVLVVGAGGAARGVLEPLLASAPRALVVANRGLTGAVALAEIFPGVEPCLLSALTRFAPFDLVINATSAGLQGQAPDVPASVFAAGGLAYDMTYGKGLTGFLHIARAAGVTRLHDGVGMLVEQAAESFAWWRGVRPATRAVIDRMTVPLT